MDSVTDALPVARTSRSRIDISNAGMDHVTFISNPRVKGVKLCFAIMVEREFDILVIGATGYTVYALHPCYNSSYS
jgi:hypothetical protein